MKTRSVLRSVRYGEIWYEALLGRAVDDWSSVHPVVQAAYPLSSPMSTTRLSLCSKRRHAPPRQEVPLWFPVGERRGGGGGQGNQMSRGIHPDNYGQHFQVRLDKGDWQTNSIERLVGV